MSPRRFWTDTERDQLRALYPNHSAAECAAILGRSDRSVIDQVRKLGLRKSLEWIAARSRTVSLDPNHGGKRGQFKKGLIPWNKGQTFQPGGRSAHARFKPGERPHTWRPVGHEVIRDGILWRKITDEHCGQHSRFNFRPVPLLVWEAAHGPIPKGHVVRFRPGMHTTAAAEITVDRLECISRVQNMALNSIHNYPPDIKAVIRLVARAERAMESRSE